MGQGSSQWPLHTTSSFGDQLSSTCTRLMHRWPVCTANRRQPGASRLQSSTPPPMLHRRASSSVVDARSWTAARLLPLATLLILTCFLTGTSADADLFGHLTFGRDIVRVHAVHASDPYSFTSDRPWVNHEWLAEVIMWIGYAIGGGIGLIILKLSLACAAGALLLDAWRRYELGPIERDMLLFATAFGAWPSLVTVRPQMFSLFLLAALLNVLGRFCDGQIKVLLWLPVIFAVWVNIHGGWLVGAGVLVLFTACSLFDSTFDPSQRRRLIAASLAAGLATLCNPYGPNMLTFLFETVRPDRSDIVEWLPVTQLPAIALTLWLVPTAVALTAVWRHRRVLPVSSIAIVVMLGIASFRVARIVSLYAVAVGFLLAPYARSHAIVRTQPLPRTIREWRAAAIVYLSIVSLSVTLLGRRVTMDGDWLPEPEAAAYVSTHHLHGKMFTWFNYGQYAIWHFWPAIRVSMDGRRETVFTEELRAAHRRIYDNAPEAVDEISRLNPDYVWLPVDLPVVKRLEAAGWLPLFRGPRSTILGHAGATATAAAAAPIPNPQPRPFPGP